MLKRLFISLSFLVSAFTFLHADDGWILGKYGGPSNHVIFKSTDLPSTSTSTAGLLGTAVLEKIVVSSAAFVDSSTWSVVDVYNSTGPLTNHRVQIQVSSNTNTTGYREWKMGIYLNRGFAVTHSTGFGEFSDTPGKVFATYANQLPNNYRVWSSSYYIVDTTTHVIKAGPAYLHRVSVLKAAVGNSPTVIRINNSSHTALTYGDTTEFISIDPTVIGEYDDLNIRFSSGITVNDAVAGTTAAHVMFFYHSGRHPDDWQSWDVFHATGALTNFKVFAGKGVVHAIFNGEVSSGDHFTVYDSSHTSANLVASLDGDKITERPIVIDAHLKKGLTVTSVGTTAEFSVFYRKY